MSRRSARRRHKRRPPPVTYAAPDVALRPSGKSTPIPCPGSPTEAPRYRPLVQAILSTVMAAVSGAANALVSWLLRR